MVHSPTGLGKCGYFSPEKKLRCVSRCISEQPLCRLSLSITQSRCQGSWDTLTVEHLGGISRVD